MMLPARYGTGTPAWDVPAPSAGRRQVTGSAFDPGRWRVHRGWPGDVDARHRLRRGDRGTPARAARRTSGRLGEPLLYRQPLDDRLGEEVGQLLAATFVGLPGHLGRPPVEAVCSLPDTGRQRHRPRTRPTTGKGQCP